MDTLNYLIEAVNPHNPNSQLLNISELFKLPHM